MLDSEQHKVATHYGTNLLVLAGAGSGKTSTVTQRGANLVQAGLDPRKALMMTFTNKAAKEMRERMVALFTERRIQRDIPNITTYHQFGFRLIKKYFSLLHFNHEMPTIMNEKDATNEWQNAYLRSGLTKEHFLENPVHKALPDLLSNQGLYLDNTDEAIYSVKKYLSENEFLNAYQEPLLDSLLGYMTHKYEQNVLDFNDLLTLPLSLLRNHSDIRESISGYLADVVIDESQDNNNAQYDFLKLITNTGQVPTMMIGDNDQAIYEWRGAAPGNLKNFITEFNAKTFTLERNYRSHNDIVQSAQSLVSNNKKRLDKNAYSEVDRQDVISSKSFSNLKPLSNSIGYTKSKHAYDLGRQIAKHIKQKMELGQDIGEIAILYRSQRMGYFMDKCLSELGVPTVMYAGTGLMDRHEALLTTSALRLKANPYDRGAFKRIASTVPGVGKKTIEDIIEASKEQKQNFLTGEFKGLSTKASQGLHIIKEKLLKLEDPQQILSWMKENMFEHLKRDAEKKVKADIKEGKLSDEFLEPEAFEIKVHSHVLNYLSTIETIQTSINNQIEAKDYQDNIWEVLTDLSLDAPQGKKDKTGVKLSTLHSFKGLEAEEVHIAGFSDGLMPLRDKEGQIDNPEEERRLAYVGITRAKKSLYVHHIEYYDVMSGGTSAQANRMPNSVYLKEMKVDHNAIQSHKAQSGKESCVDSELEMGM